METENRQTKPKHHSIISDIWFFVRFYRREEPLVLLLCAIEIILGAFMPLLMIYLPKIAIDLVEQRTDIGRAVFVLGGYSLLMMFVFGLKSGIQEVQYTGDFFLKKSAP